MPNLRRCDTSTKPGCCAVADQALKRIAAPIKSASAEKGKKVLTRAVERYFDLIVT